MCTGFYLTYLSMFCLYKYDIDKDFRFILSNEIVYYTFLLKVAFNYWKSFELILFLNCYIIYYMRFIMNEFKDDTDTLCTTCVYKQEGHMQQLSPEYQLIVKFLYFKGLCYV